MTRTVLTVDDNRDDLALLNLACASAKVSFRMQLVESGEEAIAYLQGTSTYADRNRFPLPDLVLLDLKMPGKSGFDVLGWIRSQADLKLMPVIVFTSSMHVEDRTRALAMGASGFIVKPVSYYALQRLAHGLDSTLRSPEVLDTRALEGILARPAGDGSVGFPPPSM